MRLLACIYGFLLLLAFSGAHAQVCTGSLGDPIFLQTFGAGPYALPPRTTSFPLAGGCPPKQTYTIASFLFGCGDRTWVQMVGDHTGDYKGNYMLVNAESQAGLVYGDTVRNACPNTVYQFGFWATSVMTSFACDNKAVLPNLKYTIKTLSGQVLATDSTGNLPIVFEKKWKLYPVTFKTPPGATAFIFSISIDPPFGCGSGFAIDDISIQPCGPQIDALLDGKSGPAEVCANYPDPFILSTTYSTGFTDPVLQWQISLDSGKHWSDIAGATNSTYAIPRRSDGPASYRASIAERDNIASLQCRVNSNVIFTSVHPVPPHIALADVFGCIGKTFFFPAPDPYAVASLWTGPNGYHSTAPNASIPSISYADTGLYIFQQDLRFGCKAVDSLFLKVYPGTTLTLQPVHAICEGQQEQLQAMATGNVSFTWIPATGLSNPTIANPVARPTDSTEYKLVVTNQYGCKDSVQFRIDVYRKPVANAGPDKTILAGDTAVLEGSVSGTGINYSWTPGNQLSSTQEAQPRAWPSANSSYTMQANSTLGCGSSSDEVKVKVYNSFLVPNAFSPNGDGVNDRFGILQLDNYKVEDFSIYSRFGQRVFHTSNKYASWDGYVNGEPQPAGGYVYQLRLRSSTGRLIQQKGSLLLLR